MRGLSSSFPLLSVAFVGCLDASHGDLAYKDTDAPSVFSTTPTDRGTITRTTAISITFTEVMDTRTLGAGIQVLKSGTNVPIVLGIPSPDQVLQTEQDVPQRYTVTATPVSGSFEQSVGSAFDYTLVLSQLLTDEAGNALAAEVRIRFSVM